MKKYCCICGKELKDETEFYNPTPLRATDEICCHQCNSKYVIPSRDILWEISDDEYASIAPYLQCMTRRDLANTLKRKEPIKGFKAFANKCISGAIDVGQSKKENINCNIVSCPKEFDWIIRVVPDAYDDIDELRGLVNMNTYGLEKYGIKNLSVVVEQTHVHAMADILNQLAQDMISEGEFEPNEMYTITDDTGAEFCFTVVEAYNFGEPTLRIVFENEEGLFVSVFMEDPDEVSDDEDVVNMWSNNDV